ncbi:MAG TPA: hypothetical protein VNX68_05455 [Nitrosopumilaceae archaeon]|jgi:hypothetical protein|nr:hypothetical protein [Nitrosopumilaceae archaeon]
MRAAFGGYLGKEMKAHAKMWAEETPNISKLPNKVGTKSNKTHKSMKGTSPRGMGRNENVENPKGAPHPFKHTDTHDANSMAHMVKHMPYKLSVAHPAHPAHKDFKAATEHVQHAGGHTGKMEVKGV